MLEIGAFRCFQLWNDALCKHLAEFHAPLVEGVDVPDTALSEDLVLIQGDELAQQVWGQLGRENRVGGMVSRE